MSSKLSVKHNNSTKKYTGGEIIKYGNSQVKELYVVKNKIKTLVWQYDVTAPSLNITAPTGSSTTSFSNAASSTYRVQGTVTDTESGVKSVTVNGESATLTGNTWYRDIALTKNNITKVTVKATDNAGNSISLDRYVYLPDTSVTSVAAYSGNQSLYDFTWGDVGSGYASCSSTCYFKIPIGAKKITISGTAFPGNPWIASVSRSYYVYTDSTMSELITSGSSGVKYFSVTIDVSAYSSKNVYVKVYHAYGNQISYDEGGIANGTINDIGVEY